MSVQLNQFILWAIRMPYEWHEEWEKKQEPAGAVDFYDRFQGFMEDSAFDTKINHKDGIHCLFDGCNGKWIFIGRILAKSAEGDFLGFDPVEMPAKLTDLEKELIACSVERNFGVKGEFKCWLVTMQR